MSAGELTQERFAATTGCSHEKDIDATPRLIRRIQCGARIIGIPITHDDEMERPVSRRFGNGFIERRGAMRLRNVAQNLCGTIDGVWCRKDDLSKRRCLVPKLTRNLPQAINSAHALSDAVAHAA